MDEEFFKRLGLSVARGVPQMATGFVDLAGLPFTMTGLLEPEEVVGSTAYLTEMGLLPPPQEGIVPETMEMISSAMSPSGAGKELLSGLLGVTAYHGGPRLFKQFDPAMAGTGEGAQAYGAGAGYLASEMPVAERYAGKTSSELFYKGKPMNRESASNTIDSAAWAVYLAEGDKAAAKASGLADPKKIDKIDPSKFTTGGYLYKGDIPDEIIPSMMDWNKPFAEQPENVKDAFRRLFNDPNVADEETRKWFKETYKGPMGNYYDQLAMSFNLSGKEDVSRLLSEQGVPGIRYLERGTKGVGEGTSNYVVFKPEDFVVQEINNIPIEEWIKKGLLD